MLKTGCFGLCSMGPIVMIYPEGACYTRVTPGDVAEIVEEHIIKGRIVKRLLHMEGDNGEAVTSLSDTKFYKHQFRIALRNCGVINPNPTTSTWAWTATPLWNAFSAEQTPPQEIIDCLKSPACEAGAARASPLA